MMRIRIKRRALRPRPPGEMILPLDPRDPDVVRVKRGRGITAGDYRRTISRG
jgi:hypothetical protein